MTDGNFSGQRFQSDEQAAVAAKHDEEAAMYLIEKYKPLVLHFSRARFLAGGEHEDLVQEGMIGLYKAIRDYDPSRDTSFSSFAGLCIDRQILKAIEAYGRDKMKPLNESVELTDDEEPYSGQTLGSDPEHIVIEREAADEKLRLLRGRLSRFENSVLDLYLEGCDWHEIANRLGKPPKTVDNALQRIRRKSRGM
ncbi:MAG: sigma-70 family RNA polymerase sigma factor [Chordicoccus sp.]|jgi:RNA polymerase sporulation-specific sigma factor